MGYKRLSGERKKAISVKANAYAKDNYKQIALKLKPEIAEQFDALCDQEGVSRPEMLLKLLQDYNS